MMPNKTKETEVVKFCSRIPTFLILALTSLSFPRMPLLFIAILVCLWVMRHLLRRGLVAKTTTPEAVYSQIYFKHYNTQYQYLELSINS